MDPVVLILQMMQMPQADMHQWSKDNWKFITERAPQPSNWNQKSFISKN